MKQIIDIIVSNNQILINRFVFFIGQTNITDNELTLDPKCRPITLRSDFVQTLYFIRQLNSSLDYRQLVYNNLKFVANNSVCKRMPALEDGLTSGNIKDEGSGQVIHLLVELKSMDHLLAIDTKWNKRILNLVVIRLRVEDSLSWLSTLGGAYSSLGEYDIHCAVKAGQISVSQLRLAVITGDPNLVAKCGIFMAYSLCQQHKRRDAILMIRRTLHPFINNIKYCDKIIISMFSALCYRIKHFNKN